MVPAASPLMFGYWVGPERVIAQSIDREHDQRVAAGTKRSKVPLFPMPTLTLARVLGNGGAAAGCKPAARSADLKSAAAGMGGGLGIFEALDPYAAAAGCKLALEFGHSWAEKRAPKNPKGIPSQSPG